MRRLLLALAVLLAALWLSVGVAAAPTTFGVGPIGAISASCSSQNAEAEQALGAAGSGYVDEIWMGCQGIGFARSTDGGKTFGTPITLPGGGGSSTTSWDPTVAVAPNGNVYAAFIVSKGGAYYPVVDASFDHGQTFPQITPVVPPDPKNWGDRPFLAVGPDNTVYITWDYGPERTSIVYACSHVGSCAFTSGDLNIVLQKSTDNGKTFGPLQQISPGFPWSGADAAPLVVEPSGKLDVLYQDFPTNATTHALSPGVNYFTSSTDGGTTWSKPVEVGSSGGTMATWEWWIEPSIGIDAGGALYAAWDTQGTGPGGAPDDIGWLSYSTDGGATWSAPTQGPSDQSNVPHIMQVTGGAAGNAFVGWLSDSDPRGYALYLRPFSVTKGWLAPAQQISALFGASTVWPGDTFGLSTIDPNDVMASWGSAALANRKKSDIFAAKVSAQLP
jgi:hypothetical protein